MERVMFNDRWPLLVPEHRAARPGWRWWEQERHHAMYAAIRPGDVLFDIGAEEGDQTALYGTWGAKVVIIEPSPQAWPWIMQTWAHNVDTGPEACFVGFCDQYGTGPNVSTPWPTAAYETIRYADFGFRHLDEQGDSTPTITIDRISNLIGPPDVITMDVEGSELEALRGAEMTLRRDKPIVFVSIHPEFMRDMYRSYPEQLHLHMEQLGYEGRFLCTDHEEHWMFQHPNNKWMGT